VKSRFFEVNRIKGKWHQEVYNAKGEKCMDAYLTIVHASDGAAKRLPQDVYEMIASFVDNQ